MAEKWIAGGKHNNRYSLFTGIAGIQNEVEYHAI